MFSLVSCIEHSGFRTCVVSSSLVQDLPILPPQRLTSRMLRLYVPQFVASLVRSTPHAPRRPQYAAQFRDSRANPEAPQSVRLKCFDRLFGEPTNHQTFRKESNDVGQSMRPNRQTEILRWSPPIS